MGPTSKEGDIGREGKGRGREGRGGEEGEGRVREGRKGGEGRGSPCVLQIFLRISYAFARRLDRTHWLPLHAYVT